MPTQIGSAAVVLTASADQMVAGLDKAQAKVGQWAAKVESTAAKATAAVSGGGTAGAVLARVTGWMNGATVGVGTKAGMALGSAILGGIGVAFSAGAITHQAFDKLRDLARMTRQGDALGIDSTKFLSLAASLAKVGVEGDEVSGVLGHLAKHVEEARLNGGEAAVSFNRLKLNAADLSKLTLDQQFGKVADAIKALPPGSQQAAAAMAVFGKEGTKLVPVLAKGSAGLADMEAKQKKLGLALSQLDVSRIQKADAALGNAKATWQGIITRVAASIAPAVEDIANRVAGAIERAAPAITRVADEAQAAVRLMGAGADEAVGGFGRLVEAVNGATESSDKLTVSSHGMGFSVINVAKDITAAFNMAWQGIEVGFAYLLEKLYESLSNWAANTDKLLDGIVKAGANLPGWLGGDWFEGQKGRVNQWADDYDTARKAMKEWREETLRDWGKPGLASDEWFNRTQANMKKVETFAKGVKGPNLMANGPPKAAEAMLAGSAAANHAAVSWTMSNLNAGGPTSLQQQQLQASKEAVQWLKKNYEALKGQVKAELNVI